MRICELISGKTALRTLCAGIQLLSAAVYGQADRLPVYSPEEAIEILSGARPAELPYFKIDYNGDGDGERSGTDTMVIPPIPSMGRGELMNSPSRLAQGEEASAIATGMFFSTIVHELGKGDAINFELLSYLYDISIEDAFVLGRFAQEVVLENKTRMRSERSLTCNSYEISKLERSRDEAIQEFTTYFSRINGISQDYFSSVYSRLPEIFSANLYEKVSYFIEDQEIHIPQRSTFDLISSAGNAADYFDTYCANLGATN